MSEYLTKEDKKKIFAEFGGSETNTGSAEGQIALFTHRIKGLSDHLKVNKNDNSSRNTLLTLVGKRRRLLNYLAAKDIEAYRKLIEKLKIRK